ncbi:TPA: GNAT family N-acetyltransferase [Clostridioides difficile]|uniref:GNAT family N-acetyltransferase n=1 Tax=Clostridioides difficile TaxID=1496 RepID=UPI00038C9F83|nr:GNAT family N-acetyltransferase [Clostridioides difficile]OFU28753.1 GNAT family acetyltransferase [Clostridium sp. HMSC19B12]EGT3663691.1 GNAT family N-acetyltransferase [Clostridioides difficile]EGT3687346.1 GNAT family N-acetyltransferase [Clostridioides difficile]EGT3694294.1 GNAT family N-acetyltransferase [Clostridioides difficile]EGT3961854.1 GNAT family N-acetyltransferase [Clostridioides difficile]
MEIRYAKEEEIESIKEIWSYCFNDTESFMKYYFNDKYKSENTVVALDEGKIISSLQLNQYKLLLNSKVYNTSYVVGVSTLPEGRGAGYMNKVMKFTLNELYKKGQLVSILMPIDYRLYRRFGYEHCYDQIEYTINTDDLKNFKSSGKMIKSNLSQIDDLIQIDRTFLNEVNGNVLKDEHYYENLFKEIQSEDGFLYIHEGNEKDGYIVYFLQEDKLFVRELFYKNIDALKSMLKFIYNHNTQCKIVTISTPTIDKIRFILDNPKDSDIKIKPFMMGRVINVKKFIEDIDIEKDINSSFNLLIEDKFIDENNGLFKIYIQNKKVSVEQLDKKGAEKPQEDFDIKLDINTLTQLSFSYIDVNEAIFLNDIKDVSEETLETLNCIFSKKNNYINEYI